MFQLISMKQAEWYLSNSRAFTLADVRNVEEYEEGHLYGAISIPLEEMEMRAGEIRKDLPVIIYCAHGSKSLMAARILDRMGYSVMAASGGLASYRGRFYVDRHI